jgi:hypothetical protein
MIRSLIERVPHRNGFSNEDILGAVHCYRSVTLLIQVLSPSYVKSMNCNPGHSLDEGKQD